MNNIRPIIQSIRSLLESGMPNSMAGKTAEAYARQCAEAEERLSMASAMLEKGSEYQALQVAEQDPPLLDLVGALSFGEEKVWQDFCEAHQLKVAPRLNAKTVQALDALYARGITANHPLYKDFRAAVLSREDDKCLQILRTILKLNPSDDNARKELQRLDHKRFQQTLAKLREALKSDDDELIACLVEILAAAAPEEKLQRSNAYVAGAAIRRNLRRKQAEHQLPTMVELMLGQQAEQDWRSVGMGLESLQALLEEHEIQLSEESIKQSVEALSQYHERESSADQKRRDFQNTLRSFVAQMDEVETRLTVGSSPGYEEIAGWDESFARRWKDLQSHQMPVPDETLARLQTGGQALRSRLNHMRRVRHVRTFAKAAAITGLLASVAATGLHGWKARSLSRELAGYQNQHICRPAEELIHKLRTDDGWLLRWPFLQSRIEAADVWSRQVRITEHQTEAAVQSLEASFDGDSSRLPPGLLVKQLEEAEALADSLPQDLADEPHHRLIAVRNRVDHQLARLGKELATGTDESLTAIEQESGELSFEQPASKTAQTVKQIASRLVPLEAALQPETDALRLPDALESRIVVQRQRLQTFEDELKKYDDVRAETAAADSLESYKAALAGWKEIRFVETASAAAALEATPSERVLQARLLTDGDESALKAVMEDSAGPHMMAATPNGEDLRILFALRDDEFLNNVWENRVADYSHGGLESTLCSSGTLTQARIGENLRWTGRFHDPLQSSPSVMFIKRDLVRVQAWNGYVGIGVLGSRLSPTSAFISSLQLNRITDEEGRRYLCSLLEVFDKIMQDRVGSPLAKAYLMERLESLLMHQAHAWGLHLCPSLRADLNELHQILGALSLRSEDWLVASKRDSLTAPLGAYFKRCEGRSYLDEAMSQRILLRDAALAGVRFGGYVEMDSTLVLNKSGRAMKELWVLARDGGKPKLVRNLKAGNPLAVAEKIVSPEALPLSPVFFIPLHQGSLLPKNEAGLADARPDQKSPLIETAFLPPP